MRRIDAPGRLHLNAAAGRLHPESHRVHVARSTRHGHRKHAQFVGDGSHAEERFSEDARTIGREYGRSLVAEKVGLTAAVVTFNSMRRSLEETASQIANEAGLSTEEAVEAVESTLELADQILEGMASVYENAR